MDKQFFWRFKFSSLTPRIYFCGGRGSAIITKSGFGALRHPHCRRVWPAKMTLGAREVWSEELLSAPQHAPLLLTNARNNHGARGAVGLCASRRNFVRTPPPGDNIIFDNFGIPRARSRVSVPLKPFKLVVAARWTCGIPPLRHGTQLSDNSARRVSSDFARTKRSFAARKMAGEPGHHIINVSGNILLMWQKMASSAAVTHRDVAHLMTSSRGGSTDKIRVSGIPACL